MPNYDFKALSPIDFEILVRDLLQKELQLTLESFAQGRDTGIDFRYISGPGNQLIVQCKHYADSTFSTLFSRLKNHELEKVIHLSPQRYILATSQRLTEPRKKRIKQLFEPFIQTESDIYGKEDLNNLLGKFREVERNTFKLWLSSAVVFDRLFRSRSMNLSRETLSKIQRDAKFYVQNESFQAAVKILERHNFCLIVGVPGIGKTMLAEMLLLRYHSRRWEIIKIESDISEARDAEYSNAKRIFYYDDFLGQASLADKFRKNEDQSLLDFIVARKRSRVSKLILTTREYILNNTKLVYEKIDRARFDLETCTVDLASYTRLNRAQILFNHIYFSELSKPYKKALLKDRSYLQIIDHPNYNPRIIEYMTDSGRLSGIPRSKYITRFIATLDNPEELWRHAFTSQILPESRILLMILVTLPRQIFLEDLGTAFTSYCDKNASVDNRDQSEMLRRALKELEGSFINVNKSAENIYVEFQNPSVRDFLQSYLAANWTELRRVIVAIASFDQLFWLWEHQDAKNSFRFRKLIKLRLSSEYLKALESSLRLPVFSLQSHWSFNNPSVKYRSRVSLERRVSLIVSVAKYMKDSPSRNLLNRSMRNLRKELASGNIDSSYIVNLLKELRRQIAAKEWKDIASMTKVFLLNNLRDLDDFRVLLSFAHSFPKEISSKEMTDVRREFPSSAKRYVFDDLDIDDPDDYRTYYSEIESMADELGVDVSETLEEIEEAAWELEQQAEDSDDDDDVDEKPASDQRHTRHRYRKEVPDTEIDSIFSALETL
jgi:hypothetical protein